MSRRAARESERGQAAERDLRDALERSQDPTAQTDAPADAPAPAGLPEPVDHVTTTLPQVAGYRIRDFSPEGRRSPGTIPAQSAPTDDGAPLNYRTQAAAPIVSSVPSALRSGDGSQQRAAQPVPPQREEQTTPDNLNAPDRTMTRRELRALREAQAAAENSAPPQLIEPQKPASSGLGAPLSVPTPALPVPPAAIPTGQPAAPSPTPAAPPTPEPHVPERVAPRAEPVPKIVPQAPVPLVQGSAPAAPKAPAPAPAPAPAAAKTPAPDFDSLIAHDGGSSHYAPSALVLPSIPTHSDLPRALDGTGEILITGSMDLPRGYGISTAEHSGLDGIEVDRLLDEEDRSVSATNSTPVRASRAVSTHTATRGMIQAKRPSNGNKMLAVLAVTASALAVVVVGLVVVGFLSGTF